MMDSHWADSQTYVRVFDAKSSDNKSENDSQRICLHDLRNIKAQVNVGTYMVAAIELAWNALLSKAFPEDQGYLGTLPPAVRGMIDRRMAEAKARGEEGPLLGDVQHMAGTPLEVGEGMGEALPMRTPRGAYRRVARDISPIQELSPQMMGHRVMARKPTLPMGETVSGMGLTPEQEAGMFIEPQTAMANLPMYEAAPEQSFFTPREQFLAREGATDAARRQVRGSGGGRFQQIRAGTIGGKRTDMSKKPRPVKFGSAEGMATGARLGASSEFAPAPEKKPSMAERLAAMAAEANPNITVKPPKEEKKEKKPTTPRNETAETAGRAVRAFDRTSRSIEGQSNPFATYYGGEGDPATMAMFADPSGPEAQAAQAGLGAAHIRARIAAFDKAKELARQRQGR
jgi:hypothetical protein